MEKGVFECVIKWQNGATRQTPTRHHQLYTHTHTIHEDRSPLKDRHKNDIRVFIVLNMHAGGEYVIKSYLPHSMTSYVRPRRAFLPYRFFSLPCSLSSVGRCRIVYPGRIYPISILMRVINSLCLCLMNIHFKPSAIAIHASTQSHMWWCYSPIRIRRQPAIRIHSHFPWQKRSE